MNRVSACHVWMRPLVSTVPVVAMVGLTVWATSAAAQETRRRFEIASVTPSIGSVLSIPIAPGPPDGIALTNAPLESIIRYSYNVPPFGIVGLPAWAREERFDILAKARGPISDVERQGMLRVLLTERLGLVAHFDAREQDIYVMKPVRADKRLGPRLTTRPECDAWPCESSGSARAGSIQLRAVTLPRLAEGILSAMPGQLILDQTGIVGTFDVDLSWPDGGDVNDERPAFFTAMEEQLGLTLESQRRRVNVLVIERLGRLTPD